MVRTTTSSARLLAAGLLGIGGFCAARELIRHRRRIDLHGRTVLITGGSRGLGLALGRECAGQGARVAFCARDHRELDAAEADIRRLAAQVRGFVCDLRDAKAIAHLIETVESELGPIDMLINNAGTIVVGPVQNMSADDFREVMEVNFWPALHTSLAMIPRMRKRGGGRIVNIASIGGKMPVPHLAAYCASKFALVGLSGALRAELAGDGILVTTVDPGLMNTGSPRNAWFAGRAREEYAWFSISDALPGITMSASRAARKIVAAAREGRAEVILTLPAKLGARLYGLAPAFQTELTALVARLMPGPDGSEPMKRGYESESFLTRSFVRTLGHRAEREFLQRIDGHSA